MKHSLPKQYSSKLWRAIIEFDLINPHDRILVGLSGGKDSTLLLYGLAVIQKHSPIPFTVGALTVDLGFEPPPDFTKLKDFCRDLGVPFAVERTQIAAMAITPEATNPCAKCAHFRRGAMNAFATAAGYNKIALAHHYDDAVETFLMSILYAGKIQTFRPKTYLERTGLTVIRPLVYFREKEIRAARTFLPVEPLPSPCPANGRTTRQEIKELIRALERRNKFIFTNLAAAMREGSLVELWPPALTDGEKAAKYQAVWRNQQST